MKVCEKVQAKQVTSYNEVADELVREFTAPFHPTPMSPSEQVGVAAVKFLFEISFARISSLSRRK